MMSDESGPIPADQWTPFADDVVEDGKRVTLEIVEEYGRIGEEYKRGERR
jgi:hypothetical protein